MATQFIPRYEGHEPPRHFAEIRQPKLCHLEMPAIPATPVPMTSKELRAKTARQARTDRANARKAACQHPTLTRVYGNDCAVRCADCKWEIPVADKAERNRLCPKAPGQVTAHYDLNGESLTIYELAARFRVDWRTIWGRMNRGAKLEDALYPSRQRRKVA